MEWLSGCWGLAGDDMHYEYVSTFPYQSFDMAIELTVPLHAEVKTEMKKNA